MATGKFALSTLHEIFGHCNGEKALQEKCHVKRALQKNVMLSQQGVRFVISSRGKKNAKSSYLSFVCRQKIIFVFVFAFVICFWREGRGPKKIDILEKWKNGKWKNGKWEHGKHGKNEKWKIGKWKMEKWENRKM